MVADVWTEEEEEDMESGGYEAPAREDTGGTLTAAEREHARAMQARLEAARRSQRGTVLLSGAAEAQAQEEEAQQRHYEAYQQEQLKRRSEAGLSLDALLEQTAGADDDVPTAAASAILSTPAAAAPAATAPGPRPHTRRSRERASRMAEAQRRLLSAPLKAPEPPPLPPRPDPAELERQRRAQEAQAAREARERAFREQRAKPMPPLPPGRGDRDRGTTPATPQTATQTATHVPDSARPRRSVHAAPQKPKAPPPTTMPRMRPEEEEETEEDALSEEQRARLSVPPTWFHEAVRPANPPPSRRRETITY